MADHEVDFDAFVLARSPALLLRTAYLLVQDESLAEDLLQTALTKAWFAWGRVKEPEAYVRRILVTTSASWWRRKWTRETPTADLLDCSVSTVKSQSAKAPAKLRLDAAVAPVPDERSRS